ncbi:MAG: alcohol dehydrogenase catalytic domain-containing protein [Nitrospirae bacterium]|nr:alcohol dehydrogenase catalytic domain-containing protein [Nitrospirota bacterium]
MRVLTFDTRLSLRKDYPVPKPGPGEALIRVTLAGICATDLEIVRGYMAYRGIPGHEFVGIVEESPDRQWIGRRVVGEINAACGRCPTCLAGRRTHCPHRTVLGIEGRDGAFADYLSLPVANLHAVPENVPDEEAVFAEPLAAAFRIPEQVAIGPESQVYVLGDGRLGLLVAQVLHATGCRLTLIGKHREKLALADQWGIQTALLTSVPTSPADVVVDCTGSPAGLQQAMTLTRPLGTLVLKTTCADPFAFNPSPLVIHEITVVGSRCGPFAPALEALRTGAVQVTPMIHEVYPLAEGVRAFETDGTAGVFKVLLKP